MFSPYSYKLPLFVSIVLHALVVAMLLVEWPSKVTIPEPVPQHVMAEIVQVESAAEKERKRKAEQVKRQQQEAKRKAEQQRQAAEKKKREEAAAKAAAEKKAKEAAIKAKAEADKKAAEQKKAEQQKAAEQKKIAQQQAAEKELFDRLFEEQLVAEQKEQEQARLQAERAMAIESDFMDQIRAHVSSYWRYPSVVKPEQEVTVKISLVPTGQVVQVVVTKGSGNALLDSSVVAAVNQASPLPVPKDMQVFEKSFRNFTMKFRPENASW